MPIFNTHKKYEILKLSLLAGFIFTIFLSANVAYRIHFNGITAIFGKSIHASPGLHSWSQTWFNTENERHDIIWKGYKGKLDYNNIPQRAFSDDLEKEKIMNAFEKLEQTKTYNIEVDTTFQIVANKRIQDNWFVNTVLIRTWETLHLWINLETNSQLREALAYVPSSVRKPFLAFLLVSKILIVTIGCLSIIVVLKKFGKNAITW